MPGGETLREVQLRTWTAIEAIAREAPADRVAVVVSHNFVIRTALCQALGLPLTQFRRLRVALASKSVIDITDGRASVVHLNDVSHLGAAGLADDL
jgi:broad specificity phosphatase PhoE